MYILRKFCTQYGKKIRDYSRSQNVAWKIPEGVGQGIVYVDMCWYEPERSLRQTSWDGGVLEYIMLLLCNVSSV